ncbi:MAG TPA: protein-glutamate O-methyltransferase CheR, partial [Thermodesulfovibrionales bacterium]|nr:protein-glutamate O-methyltransferase CheR [Thermodesulfovibrionales bacterium]
ERRLSRRLKLHHLGDFRDYYRLLLYDKRKEDELTAAIEVLTVNETFFFREKNQLKAFSDEILPEIGETNREKKKIRIWSAGCSTGEEPYTIAMLILEYGGLYGWDIEILGSDINQRVLTTARRGIYRKNSFRTAEPSLIRKYFKEEDGSFLISEDVKRLVSFSCLNLLDPFKVRFMGQMDVIFCRNVLIYFDHPARKKVVENFHSNLVEGGYLLLGHAESLVNISTSFALRHLKNDMVYQKPITQGAYIKC